MNNTTEAPKERAAYRNRTQDHTYYESKDGVWRICERSGASAEHRTRVHYHLRTSEGLTEHITLAQLAKRGGGRYTNQASDKVVRRVSKLFKEGFFTLPAVDDDLLGHCRFFRPDGSRLSYTEARHSGLFDHLPARQRNFGKSKQMPKVLELLEGNSKVTALEVIVKGQ